MKELTNPELAPPLRIRLTEAMRSYTQLMNTLSSVAELLFEVIQEREGGYVAACYSENIYTEGATLEELHSRISGAIERKFQGRVKPSPSAVKLILYRE